MLLQSQNESGRKDGSERQTGEVSCDGVVVGGSCWRQRLFRKVGRGRKWRFHEILIRVAQIQGGRANAVAGYVQWERKQVSERMQKSRSVNWRRHALYAENYRATRACSRGGRLGQLVKVDDGRCSCSSATKDCSDREI